MVVGVGVIGHVQALGFADYGADMVLADFNSKLADKAAEDVRARGKKALAIAVVSEKLGGNDQTYYRLQNSNTV